MPDSGRANICSAVFVADGGIAEAASHSRILQCTVRSMVAAGQAKEIDALGLVSHD
jgi:hypothetical protein